ncbi:hypothetical protein ACP8HI_21330 [Paenibacillus sp. FA6]|uniref:hypothetical protein n=1 Tax=Paenibacillus sp. FA6 TaxID=3413029 RepID=UPI003F65C315
MNHQLVFAKLALSGLLVSAVVAPTMTNAATGVPKEVSATVMKAASVSKELSPKDLSQVDTISATLTTVASSWTNPLELAKIYAPNTLKEWEKTLEQYKAVVGESSLPFVIDMEMAGIEPDQAFEVNIGELTAVESTMATPLVAGEANDMSFVIDMAGIEPDEAFELNMEEMIAVGSTLTKSVQISEVAPPFIKAQIALDDAAKSKDTVAIKEALAKLLVEYKQQIADFETAK